ncbi:MAG: hypothetical protein IT370_02825 [Deltaproteobacteria bacterium]|nr:hypothetical protein [Deltaproteobacteria bacterium]
MIAFVASFALALPAGWRALDADPPGAPAARPPLSSVQVGDVRVELAVERATVAAGEDVAMRLTAYSKSGAGASEQPGASAEVEISMLERVSRSMGRNPMPALLLGERRRLELKASAKGTTIDVRFKTDRPTDAIALAGSARTFTILVKPVDPKQPGKLGKVHESESGQGWLAGDIGLNGVNANTGNGNGNGDSVAVVPVPPNGARLPGRWRNYLPPGALPAPGSAAMAVVTARVPPAYRLTLGTPPALQAGKTARLELKVKNLTQSTLKDLTLPVYGTGFEQVGAPARLSRLAPGAEVTVVLHIKASVDDPRPAVTVSGYAALGGSAGTQVQADASGKLAVTEVAALSLNLGL